MSEIEKLSVLLGECLQAHKAIITTAESCTGGGIAQAITDIPGSSQWFTHGFVTYSNQAKQELLGVPDKLLIEHGAVSQQVAEAMAAGAVKKANAQYAVAVSGVAGPGGGSAEKPVGTVWIAWKCPDKPAISQQFLFQGDRKSIRNQTVILSLKTMLELIEKNTV